MCLLFLKIEDIVCEVGSEEYIFKFIELIEEFGHYKLKQEFGGRIFCVSFFFKNLITIFPSPKIGQIFSSSVCIYRLISWRIRPILKPQYSNPD